jgi:F-type H+-transporting ATPase subunit gamma
MGAQQRIFRAKIKATQSTAKITHAMELISSSRIMKAQEAVKATQPYADALTRALTLAASNSKVSHPMLESVESPKRAAILTITADRGLAGAYSNNAIKEGERLAENLRERGLEVVTFLTGRKGAGYYKFRERPVAASWVGFADKPTYANAKEIADALLNAFTTDDAEGGVDEVHIVYTKFVSRVNQEPRVVRVVPLDVVEEKVGGTGQVIEGIESPGAKATLPLYDFEPQADILLDALLPVYIEHLVHVALLESAASEHASRQRAMKSATDNANDLVKIYIQQANQARQAEITQEISEIVGGADALSNAG